MLGDGERRLGRPAPPPGASKQEVSRTKDDLPRKHDLPWNSHAASLSLSCGAAGPVSAGAVMSTGDGPG
jgi:hypothetical protein